MKNLDLNNQQPFNSGEWFLDSIPVAKPPKNPDQVSTALQMRILCLTTATHRTAIQQFSLWNESTGFQRFTDL